MLSRLATQLLASGALRRCPAATSHANQLHKQAWASPTASADHHWHPLASGCRTMAVDRAAAIKDEQETSVAAATAAAAPTRETQQEARRLGSQLYQFAVHGKPRVARLATWSVIFLVMLARSWRLFQRCAASIRQAMGRSSLSMRCVACSSMPASSVAALAVQFPRGVLHEQAYIGVVHGAACHWQCGAHAIAIIGCTHHHALSF